MIVNIQQRILASANINFKKGSGISSVHKSIGTDKDIPRFDYGATRVVLFKTWLYFNTLSYVEHSRGLKKKPFQMTESSSSSAMKPFLPNASFFSLWKHQNTKGFLMFSRNQKGALGRKGLKAIMLTVLMQQLFLPISQKIFIICNFKNRFSISNRVINAVISHDRKPDFFLV